MHVTISSALHADWHRPVLEAARFGFTRGAGRHAQLAEMHVKVSKPRRIWRVVGGVGRSAAFARRRDAVAHANRTGGLLETHDVVRQRWTTGRAYDGVPAIASVVEGTRYLVTLKLPVTRHGQPHGRYPRTWRYEQYATAPAATFADPIEEVVHAAAHEGRHVWQFATDAPRSEIDAEHHACAVLESWRASTRGVQLALF